MQPWVTTFSILLEISPNDKHTLAFLRRRKLLHAPHALEALHATTLGKHDVHFEAIANLDIYN